MLDDIKKEFHKGSVQRIAAEDFIQDRINECVAELNKGIHLAGRPRLANQVLLKLLAPSFFIEPKTISQLLEHQVNVHGLKMIGNQLWNHREGELTKYISKSLTV